MAHPAPSTVLEFLKPITWFAPMWAYACGVVSSGVPIEGRWLLVFAGVLLAGPLICATSQAVNDWYDRDVDAINEPNRPIPSGRLPGRWGFYIALGWTALSLLVATALGPWGLGAAVIGLALAWAYSAPPIRLKRNGWWGNAAVGACYEGLPWFTGRGGHGRRAAGLAHPGAGRALQHRRPRHHDAQRFQVGRRRPADGHRLAAGAAGHRQRGALRLRRDGRAADRRGRHAGGLGPPDPRARRPAAARRPVPPDGAAAGEPPRARALVQRHRHQPVCHRHAGRGLRPARHLPGGLHDQEVTDLRCRGGRRRTGRRHRRRRSGAARTLGRPARQGGQDQALRRRHPAPPDPGFRDPGRPAGREDQVGPHDRPVRQARHDADRRRLRRHGRPRGLRRMAAQPGRRRRSRPAHRQLRADFPRGRRRRDRPLQDSRRRRGMRAHADRDRRRRRPVGGRQAGSPQRHPHEMRLRLPRDRPRPNESPKPTSTRRAATSGTRARCRPTSTPGSSRMATPSASAPVPPTRASRSAARSKPCARRPAWTGPRRSGARALRSR